MAGAVLRINGTPRMTFLGPPRPNHDCRPPPATVMVSTAPDASYWASIDSDVRAHLQRAIPVRPPTVVFEPMRNIILTAPKSPAPALCVAACETLGGRREDAVAAASALHVIHSVASTRAHRTGPTSPATGRNAYGPNIELLMGDGIAPFAFELLARSDDMTGHNSGRIHRVMVELARAAGAQGAIRAQMDDGVEEEEEEGGGGLCACGAACGAILGGGSEEEIEKFRRYGARVGMIRRLLERSGGEEDHERVMEFAQGLKETALQELTGFDESKVELFCSPIRG